MRNRRVSLFSSQHLLGEVIEQALSEREGLELTGHWLFDGQVMEHLDNDHPDLVILAEDDTPPEELSRLTAQLLECYPDLPIFRVTLKRNQIQVYSSHVLPARQEDLIELIRQLPFKMYE
jgi:hypothetical protein